MPRICSSFLSIPQRKKGREVRREGKKRERKVGKKGKIREGRGDSQARRERKPGSSKRILKIKPEKGEYLGPVPLLFRALQGACHILSG